LIVKTKTLQVIVVLAAALVITAGASALALARSGGDTAALTEHEIVAIAEAESDGAVIGVEKETEGGTLVYEVAFDSGTEVEVDANTGEVLEVEHGVAEGANETEDAND
jgi:uncharacterized membrane protein YkoI